MNTPKRRPGYHPSDLEKKLVTPILDHVLIPIFSYEPAKNPLAYWLRKALREDPEKRRNGRVSE